MSAISHQPNERKLPEAHSLREAAASDNTLQGYVAMNHPDPQAEIVREAASHPFDEHASIEALAYQFYLARGGESGSAEDDWFRAEREIRGSSQENRSKPNV